MLKAVENAHVIVVNDYAYINGGASKVAISSALALANSGYEVSFLSLVGPVMSELEQSPVLVHCLNQHDILSDPIRLRAVSRGIWNTTAAAALQKLLQRADTSRTIVHMHGFVKAMSSSIVNVCQRFNIPVVLTLHDYFTACPNGGFYDYQQQKICTLKPLSMACVKTHCDVRAYSHKLWRVLRNSVQKNVGGVPGNIKDFIYISELSRSLLFPYLPSQANLHFVPNPVDVEKSERITAELNALYVFIGRLSPEKGAHTFCEVMTKLQCQALVIGDGEEREQLQAAYPKITFSGWLSAEAINLRLKQSKFLVFCTHWYETQGLVVYEALAQGLPVIVPDHCSAAEAVHDNVNGILYNDTGQGISLEEAVQKLENMPESGVKSLSVAAYENYWQAPSDMQTHVRNLHPVYEVVLQQHVDDLVSMD